MTNRSPPIENWTDWPRASPTFPPKTEVMVCPVAVSNKNTAPVVKLLTGTPRRSLLPSLFNEMENCFEMTLPGNFTSSV